MSRSIVTLVSLVGCLAVSGCGMFFPGLSANSGANNTAAQGNGPSQHAEVQQPPAPSNQTPSSSSAASSFSSPASRSSSKPERYQARISVHSACKRTVKTFRGRVNGRHTGSGTHRSHSSNSNSSSSYSLSGEDEFCVLGDNGRDILSCIKPQNGARMQITEGCSGLRRR